MLFKDRAAAGKFLGGRLQDLAGRDCVVLGLPRGGVPVAAEVAKALNAPLDVLVVRKLGAPQWPELAVGAIASGGARVLHEETIRRLSVSAEQLSEIEAAEKAELKRREALYRGKRKPVDVAGKTVVLVDDGLATGATMTAAARAIRQRGARRLVIAVPVGAPETCLKLKDEADEVICGAAPDPFFSVGSWYDDFEQTTDEEVRLLLDAAGPASARSHGRGTKAATIERAISPVAVESDYAPLLELAHRGRFILLGEASHGTREFYRDRIELTKALIELGGVRAVAAEADWPDAYRVNRFVLGRSNDPDAETALSDFKRFPSWMWRNVELLDFVAWLKARNAAHPGAEVGFYGLDLYSLNASRQAVIDYLEKADPGAAERARRRYGCFDRFDGEAERYAHAARAAAGGCEEEAAAQETLGRLSDHIEARTPGAKVVVWAHNSHLGDARATEVRERGELNVGQLARERWGRDAFSVGFTTYHGAVTAARDWGGLAERRTVRPALSGSYEAIFHALGTERFFMLLRDNRWAASMLGEPRLERAIGVLYRPETERWSHYISARLSEQFDAVIHTDRTTAVQPLERTSQWDLGEAPETFPTAL